MGKLGGVKGARGALRKASQLNKEGDEPWPGGSVSWSIFQYTERLCMGLIPSQDTYLGCGLDLHLGLVQEATDRCYSFTSMFLS